MKEIISYILGYYFRISSLGALTKAHWALTPSGVDAIGHRALTKALSTTLGIDGIGHWRIVSGWRSACFMASIRTTGGDEEDGGNSCGNNRVRNFDNWVSMYRCLYSMMKVMQKFSVMARCRNFIWKARCRLLLASCVS